MVKNTQSQGQQQQQTIKDSGNSTNSNVVTGGSASSTVKNSGNSTIAAGAVSNTVTGGSSSSSSSISEGAVKNTNTVSTTGTVGTVTSGSNTNTIGCLVNCADTSQSTKTLADSAVAVANIQAQAARDVASTTITIKNTPSVSGPALTSSNDTCMGSTSGSANVPGIGIGFGTSWVDVNCKMLKNSRELWNMGMKGAAMALMCTDPINREALELTGFECPQTTRDKQKQAQVASVSSSEPTDPIVRSRMGLKPLK